MRVRNFLIAVAVLSLAIPGFANARGATADRATGGGQTLVDSQGAGNTIAFTARGTVDEATGQVQYIDRTEGTGQEQVKFHGIVQCLRVMGAQAELAGVERDSGQPFNLLVRDNGEGAMADNDAISFSEVNDVSCADENDDKDTPDVALARGNAQVHDAP